MYSVYKIILSLYIGTLLFGDCFFKMQYGCFNVLATLVKIDNSAKPRHNIYVVSTSKRVFIPTLSNTTGSDV